MLIKSVMIIFKFTSYRIQNLSLFKIPASTFKQHRPAYPNRHRDVTDFKKICTECNTFEKNNNQSNIKNKH